MKSAKTSVSSSDSEDDEEKIRLAQSLDPDFMKNVQKTTTNQLINNGNSTKKGGGGGGDSEGGGPPVSKRSKLFDPTAMETEFVKPYSLEVTPEGQRFIAKQLAKSLEKSIKEKPLLIPSSSSSPHSTTTQMDTNLGIKLFATSKSLLTQSDLLPSPTPAKRPRPRLSSSKKKKKKSSSKSSSSSSSSDSDSEKLKSVAVSADWVLHQ